MTDILVALSMLTGSLLMLLAAIGAVRMPDLPMRMHATTKAGALGSGLIMIAVALHFSSSEVTARVIAIIAFIMLTAPVAAHVIGRAGYFVGVPLWHKILQDDLKGKYDATTHTLHSPDIYRDDAKQPPRDH